jgi:hypothetical protein
MTSSPLDLAIRITLFGDLSATCRDSRNYVTT